MDSILSAAERFLSLGDTQSALFLSQLAHSVSPTASSSFVLAQTFIRSNDYLSAANVLFDFKHVASISYLLALCLAQSNKLSEAENILKSISTDNVEYKHIPPFSQSSAQTLLAQIYKKTNRTDLATAAFEKAIKSDPLNWSAFVGLSEINPSAAKSLINANSFINILTTHSTNIPSIQPAASSSQTIPKPLKAPKTSKQKPKPASESTSTTTTSKHSSTSATNPSSKQPTNAASRKRLREGLLQSRQHPSSDHHDLHPDIHPHKKPHPLSTDNSSDNPSDTKPVQAPAETSKELQSSKVAHVAEIILHIHLGYADLLAYNCNSALRWFDLLPSSIRESSFILTLIARAHFESNNYAKAESCFKRVRELDPSRIEAMDIYGTCLWHLRKHTDLSHLGKELERTHRLAPETWCVIGNYYSVCQDHDQSIRAFSRAISLAPDFEYAHNLIAHEYMSNEDLDRASDAFRTALRINPRHYNAYYGLAQIALKQEKFKIAEFYYTKVIDINPTNFIPFVSLADIYRKNPNRRVDASEYYKHAESLVTVSSSTTKPKFQTSRAQILFELGYYADALELLQSIARIHDHTAVYTLLGKIYAAMGQHREALNAFTLAQAWYGSKPCVSVNDEIDKIMVMLSKEGDSNQLPRADL